VKKGRQAPGTTTLVNKACFGVPRGEKQVEVAKKSSRMQGPSVWELDGPAGRCTQTKKCCSERRLWYKSEVNQMGDRCKIPAWPRQRKFWVKNKGHDHYGLTFTCQSKRKKRGKDGVGSDESHRCEPKQKRNKKGMTLENEKNIGLYVRREFSTKKEGKGSGESLPERPHKIKRETTVNGRFGTRP